MSTDGKDWTPTEIADVRGVRMTPSGLALVCRQNGRPDFLIPVKLIDDDSEVFKSDTEGTLIIPEWLAVEKALV